LRERRETVHSRLPAVCLPVYIDIGLVRHHSPGQVGGGHLYLLTLNNVGGCRRINRSQPILPQISKGLPGAILKGSLNLNMTQHRDECHRLVLWELLQKLLQLTLQPASRFVRGVVEIDQEHVPNAP
jgi:hypothetical protein